MPLPPFCFPTPSPLTALRTRQGNRMWRLLQVTAPSPSRPSGSTPPPLKGWRKGSNSPGLAPFLHPFRGGGVEGVARDGEGEFRSSRHMRLPCHVGEGDSA